MDWDRGLGQGNDRGTPQPENQKYSLTTQSQAMS